MKALKILTLILLYSIMHLSKIYAQKDYVITTKHDTIYCDIRINLLSGVLRYRVSENEKYTKINTGDVIEFFLSGDSSTYVYKKLPGKVYRYTPYLKWLEKGRINLYDQEVMSGSNGTTSSCWYVSKGNDSLISVKDEGIIILKGSHKEREKAFMDLIADFPGLLEGFKRKSYTFDNIRDCIVVYNSEFLQQ